MGGSGRGSLLLGFANLLLPPLGSRLFEFGGGAPIAQPVGVVGEHAPLDLGEYVAHQAVRTWRLAITAVADSPDPQMRRLGPTGRRLRPPGVPISADATASSEVAT